MVHASPPPSLMSSIPRGVATLWGQGRCQNCPTVRQISPKVCAVWALLTVLIVYKSLESLVMRWGGQLVKSQSRKYHIDVRFGPNWTLLASSGTNLALFFKDNVLKLVLEKFHFFVLCPSVLIRVHIWHSWASQDLITFLTLAEKWRHVSVRGR